MLTRCPSCQATFSITDQQLAIASGMVRCGVCEYVFDARLYLFEPKPSDIDTSIQEQADNALSANEVDQAAEDDILAEFDETQEFRQEKQIQPESETPPAENTVNLSATEQQTQAEESFVPRIIASQVSQLEQEPSKPSSIPWLAGIFIALLVSALLIQAIAIFKVDLLPKSISERLCPWLTCVHDVPKALDKIEILNRSIYTHPRVDKALLVTVTIINRADFAQPYPTVQLSFLDIAGEVMAARTFSPNEYLKSKWHQDNLLHSGRPISLQLELIDFGEEVVGYSFDFL